MITIIIKTDNEAFQDGNQINEVKRILRDLTTRDIDNVTDKTLHDINGNNCGRYSNSKGGQS